MKVLAYWGARTAIFFAVLIAIWSVGWRDILAVIAAFIVAWLISYLALPRMRERAQAQMDVWVTRSHARQHAEDSVEDQEAEGMAAATAGMVEAVPLDRDSDGKQEPVGEAHEADSAKD